MNFGFKLGVAALVVLTLTALAAGTGLPAAAAPGVQPFFAGYWRCNSGDLRVTPQFGPWFTWRSQSGGGVSQSSVYNDTVGRGWVYVGVDSAGGYWTQTSGGWQGNTLTFTGTYTNRARAQSQRQVFTRTSNSSFSVATYRNGGLTGQNACTKS